MMTTSKLSEIESSEKVVAQKIWAALSDDIRKELSYWMRIFFLAKPDARVQLEIEILKLNDQNSSLQSQLSSNFFMIIFIKFFIKKL